MYVDCTIFDAKDEVTVTARVKDRETCRFLSDEMRVLLHKPMQPTGDLWHYRDSALTCKLRYRRSRHWVIVYNSQAACRYFRSAGLR